MASLKPDPAGGSSGWRWIPVSYSALNICSSGGSGAAIIRKIESSQPLEESPRLPFRNMRDQPARSTGAVILPVSGVTETTRSKTKA